MYIWYLNYFQIISYPATFSFSYFMTPNYMTDIHLPCCDELVQYKVSSISRLPPRVGFSFPIPLFNSPQNDLIIFNLLSKSNCDKLLKHSSMALCANLYRSLTSPSFNSEDEYTFPKTDALEWALSKFLSF